MVVLIILIILLVLGGLGFFAWKTLRINVTTEEDEAPEDEYGGEPQEQDGGEAAGEQEPPVVDLVDYFSGSEKPAAAEAIKAQTDVAVTFDRLTEFMTGKAYLNDCQEKLKSAGDEGLIYCAVSLDYDRFRYINGLKGAGTGDYVIGQTAREVQRIFPEGALHTRLGADHFRAVFPLVDLDMFGEYHANLKRLSEKIRDDINAKSALKVCVGFSTTENEASYDVNVLFMRADIARHCVKVTKGDKYEIYEESMVTSGFFGDLLMENYSDCQYDDEFILYFEKIMDINSNRITGLDALARWRHDDGISGMGRITQDTGRLPSNNDKVFYQSCRALSRLRKASRAVDVLFVDMPAIVLFKPDMDEFVATCLSEFQIETDRVAVKIESAAIRLAWTTASKQIKKLNDMGVAVCITGLDPNATHLDFLNGLKVDYIKLSGGFTAGVEKLPEQLNKCKRVMEHAAQIGAKVVFEGVDSVEAAGAMRQINAKTVQGRFTGFPAIVDDLIRELPEHVEKRKASAQTVILDEAQLSKGEWKV